MPHVSDTRFLVLHGLRLKGFGEPPSVAAVVALDPARVEDELQKLAADELVLRREGRLAGWALTAAGRAEQQRLAVSELEAIGAVDVVRGAYERFLGHNQELLEVCTAWQLKGDGPNDHTDAGYDASVIDRLKVVHNAVAPVLHDLVAVIDRYRTYAPRFALALERLDAGELEWFTKPIIDSYHTIWFELHEDLLSSLGIERSQEASS